MRGADVVLPLVAIDGPSGSGKSTVARAVARRLGAAYLDTGAMYRAVTLAVLQSGTSLTSPDDIAGIARSVDLEVAIDPDTPGIRIGGIAVDGPIRGPEVTAAVSAVSAVPAVRKLLVSRQRAVAEVALDEALRATPGGWAGAVLEGRDIGTVVLPEAPVKIFLTAQPGARAGRRAAEQAGYLATDATLLPPDLDVAGTEADLARRDFLDSSRAISPLQAAPDALVLDTTDMSLDDVVERVLQACRLAGLTVPEPAVHTTVEVATSTVATGQRP